MRIPAPPTSTAGDADAEIEALLAKADERVEARGKGEGQAGPPAPVDMQAHALRGVLWIRPWARKRRPLPCLEQGTKVGTPLPGFAHTLQSREGDEAGPWLALAQVADDFDGEKALKAFNKFWSRWRGEFIDAGTDYQAEGGEGEAGRAWLELLLHEAVGQSGRVHIFPAPDSEQEQAVQALNPGLAYQRAWRQVLNRPRLPREDTVEQAHRRAGEAVGKAVNNLEDARAEVRRLRSEQEDARNALEKAKTRRPLLAWLHARGWLENRRLARLRGRLDAIGHDLAQAKGKRKRAEKALGERQVELKKTAEALRKALEAKSLES